MAYALVGLALISLVVAIVVVKRRDGRAKANGNGYDKLGERMRQYKYKDRSCGSE